MPTTLMLSLKKHDNKQRECKLIAYLTPINVIKHRYDENDHDFDDSVINDLAKMLGEKKLYIKKAKANWLSERSSCSVT